jgi:hypothetical protein
MAFGAEKLVPLIDAYPPFTAVLALLKSLFK